MSRSHLQAGASGATAISATQPWEHAGFAARPLWVGYGGNNGNTYMATFFAKAGIPLSIHSNGYNYKNLYNVNAGTQSASANYIRGNTSSSPSSSGFNPNSGYHGATAVDGFINALGLHTYDNGVIWRTRYDQVSTALRDQGLIIGENESYQAGMYLGLYQNKIYFSTLSAALYGRYQYYGQVDLSSISGLVDGFDYETKNAYGMVGYNRKSNTLVVIQNTNDSTGFRWLRFQLGIDNSKLGLSELVNRSLIQAAVDGANGASYDKGTFTWNRGSSNEGEYRCKVAVCEDGTFWLGGFYPSSKLELARVWDDNGTMTFDIVSNLNVSTSYGIEQSSYNPGVTHQVSTDQSIVAFIGRYYYYCCGLKVYFVSTASANDATKVDWFQDDDTNYACHVAPAGGSEFILSTSDNMDSAGAFAGITSFESRGLRNGAHPVTYRQGFFETYEASTMYGAAAVVPVIPTEGTEVLESKGV